MLAVLLLLHQGNDERARIFDIVDGQVLSICQLHNSLLVEAPLRTRDQHKEDPTEYNKPQEPAQEDGQQEEVLVDEERLFVALNLHVHHDHYRCERQHAQDVQQVR